MVRDRPPPQMRTPACLLLAGRPGSEPGHRYRGPGTASDWRSGLWVVEVVVELALIVAEVVLVVAEVAFVAAQVALEVAKVATVR